MNTENIEYALNHISEEVKKTNNQNEYVIKAIEELAGNMQQYFEELANSSPSKSNIAIDTKPLENMLNYKISEILGAVKTQTRETYYSKNYYLYPEGKGGKTFLYIAIKMLAILVASVFIFLSVKFIANKVEANSTNAKHRIVLQYIYCLSNAKAKEYIEGVYIGAANDSIRKGYIQTIKNNPVTLK